MEIVIYWRQRVDYGEQNDTTCLVPKFACCVTGPSEFFPQWFSIEHSRTASPGVVLQRANLNADVIGQTINRRGIAWEFPHHVTVSSSFSAWFLYGFPYRFQRAWTVLRSMRHPLDSSRIVKQSTAEQMSVSVAQKRPRTFAPSNGDVALPWWPVWSLKSLLKKQWSVVHQYGTQMKSHDPPTYVDGVMFVNELFWHHMAQLITTERDWSKSDP